MKLLDKIHHELQPYASRPSKFIKAVGYVGQHTDGTAAQGDLYRVEYTLTMKKPEFCSKLFPDAHKIDHLYGQERALLSFLIANGSFLCQDHRQSQQGSFNKAVLNDENRDSVIKRYLNGEPMDYLNPNFIKLFVKWIQADNVIDNRWFSDYPSITYLHNFLSQFFGSRCHGMSQAGLSPSRLNNRDFTAKPLRKPEEIHERYQAFLVMKNAVLKQLARARFNIIECQYGFKWRHTIKEWFLDIEVIYAARFNNARNVLRAGLETRFGTCRGLLDCEEISGLEGIKYVSSSQSSKGSGDNSTSLFEQNTESQKSTKSSDFDSEYDEDFLNIVKSSTQKSQRKDEIPKPNLSSIKEGEGSISQNSDSSETALNKKLEQFFASPVASPIVSQSDMQPGPSTSNLNNSIADAVKQRALKKSQEKSENQSVDESKPKRNPARRIGHIARKKHKSDKPLAPELNKISVKTPKNKRKLKSSGSTEKPDEEGWIHHQSVQGTVSMTTPELIRSHKRKKSTISGPEASLFTACPKDKNFFI